MAVLTKWWKNGKKNEGMHMILRKDLSFDKVGTNLSLVPPPWSLSHAPAGVHHSGFVLQWIRGRRTCKLQGILRFE